MIHVPKYVLRYVLIFLLLSFHFLLLFNLQFTAWPEMLSYPYLRNNDFLLYKDMIHPYPPLLTMVLSLVYKMVGYHLWVLQAVAWSIILTSSLLIFLVIKTLTHRNDIALLGLAVYVLLQPFLEGNMLWFDIAIVPAVLLGMLFLLKHMEREGSKWLVLAGFSLATAALVKQTAVVFLIFAAVFIFIRYRSLKEVWKLAIGSIVLLVPLIVRLIQEDALVDFFNWTVLYPLTEWGRYPGYVQMSIASKEAFVLFLLFLPLVAIFMVNIVRRKLLIDTHLSILLLFLIGSLIAVYPRFSFFHFQPALAILIVITFYVLRKWEIKKLLIGSVVFFVILLPIIYLPVFVSDWQKEARFYSQNDTYLAAKIADLTNISERVFLLEPHSGLYVMANRLPPKRWSDNFGWYLEIPGVQEEIISRWEGNPPDVVLWRMPLPGTQYDLGTYQPQKIASWIESNYTKKEEIKSGIWLWQKKD